MKNTKRRSLTAMILAVVGVGATLCTSAANAQVQWRSGAELASNRAVTEVDQVLAQLAQAGERHAVVQLSGPLTPVQRVELELAGVTLQAWLGNNAFFAALAPQGVDAAVLRNLPAFASIRRVERDWKLHPMFARGETPKWAVVPPPAGYANQSEVFVAVYILYHSDVIGADAKAIAANHHAAVISDLDTIHGLVLELPLALVASLAADDSVMYIEPALPPFKEFNDSNRIITEANLVQAAPYNLNGAGVNVMVYDGGFAFSTHPDFQGRLTVRDNSGLSDHATHVSGTIGSAGIGNAIFKGMAPGVTIQSYGFQQAGGLRQGFLYTDPGDLLADYTNAINVHGADIANNSIGTNTAPNGYPCEWEGDYGVTDVLIDSIVRGSLGSPFRVIWANGNERGSGRCGTQYRTTAPPACAKNHITVGAMNSNNDSVTSFTSWGPADDGRMKPDISAPGCQVGADNGVTSCSSSGGYTVYCGTSMASPTVCGLSALILQDFRTLYPSIPDPRNSTLKTLLAHNAQDIEAVGPDYKTGYGSVRIQRTIDFLRTGQFFEHPISQGDVHRLLVVVAPGTPELKVTIAWDDAAGTPNVSPALVNDVDLVVLDPNGVQQFPWTLGGIANPGAPAARTQADHVNNIEQVYVASPVAGVWAIEVRGTNIPTGPQVVSGCFTPAATGDCNGNGINDLQDLANGTSLDVNGNSTPDECEPDCNDNNIPDAWDISTGTSEDCNANQTPDECDIASGTSRDCNSNGIPDSCDIAGGVPDCNGNGIPDPCEIASGASEDCNANGVPDECEPDCNLNGIADECDIASGFSIDANNDGYPDECSTLFVKADATGSGSGANWQNAFRTLDDAIAAANNSPAVAMIWVARGNYVPQMNTTFTVRPGLALYGGFAGTETSIGQRVSGENIAVLNGLRSGPRAQHVVTLTNNVGTVLDGFSIRNGSGGAQTGAGVLITGGSPTIVNCIIHLNGASAGGGVSVSNASATFIDCTIRDNIAVGGDGGGILTTGTGALTLTRCVFIQNSARESNPGFGRGAGVFNAAGSTLSVTNCVFDSNNALAVSQLHAPAGGGIANFSGSATVRNSTFIRNTASAGGGIYSAAPMAIVNCVLTGNRAVDHAQDPAAEGGGVFGAPGVSLAIDSSTIAANWAAQKGGGASFDGSIQNSVVWYNTVAIAQPPLDVQLEGNWTINFSNVASLLNGGGPNPNFPGSIESLPRFALAPSITVAGTFTAGDLHLVSGSPCLDAGNNALIPIGTTTDLDGYYRRYDDPIAPNVGVGTSPLVDMGAYELQPPPVPCPADFNGDNIVDFFDYLDFVEAFSTGLPTADFNADSVIDFFDYLDYVAAFSAGC